MSNNIYYLLGILLLLLLILYLFYQTKIMEGYSNIQYQDYQLENCNNKNLPSYGFYFQKDNFKTIYLNSKKDDPTNSIINNLFTSTFIHNVDKCNNHLYVLQSNNQLQKCIINNNPILFHNLNQSNTILSFLIESILQIMTLRKINYTMDSENKQLNFQIDNNKYTITVNSMDLKMTISNMQNYNIQEIKINNNIVYNKNKTDNKKYIFGKITYDNDPTNFIYCMCFDYYQ